jgi:hypothetical protein
MSCFILSALLTNQEIGQVNRKLPDKQQVSYLGMYPTKMAKIKREYKRLYPAGRVEFWRFAFQIAGFVFIGLMVITEIVVRKSG